MRKEALTRSLALLACLLAAISQAGETAAWGDAASEVRDLVGAHTRIVWCQVSDRADKSRGVYDLTGLDTDDGKGIRTILSPIVSCMKPLISSTGSRVVFSNRVDDEVYVVNWDGTGIKKLVSGYATDLWKDPQTGVEWVYVRTGNGRMRNAIRRYQVDKPELSELIWDKTPVDQEVVPWFQLSADGKRAASAFPWPKCGIAILPNTSWRVMGMGCWTSIAPDNSYRFFHFDGTHKHIIMYDGDGSNRRVIPLNGAPGLNGREVLYPHWTKDVRFLTMAGPGDDEEGELYLGKFNPQFTSIDRWVRVTFNHVPDRWGDAWIDPNTSPGGPAGAVAIRDSNSQ